MTDTDTLQGPALVDAVAIEVMGWEWDAWGHWLGLPDEDGCRPILGDNWHPESSWSDFGRVVERMGALGLRMALHGDPGSAFLETGCRAALKAVRAREGSA